MRKLLLVAALPAALVAGAPALAAGPARIVDCEPDEVCHAVCRRLERLGIVCLQ